MALILLATAGLVLWACYGVYWRLYLSPISHIPGPKLAAITRLYEAYYDLYLGGQYTFKIIELHKEYGPIIRISPWEIHISDPSFYDTLYASSASGMRRDKYDWFTNSFGLPNSIFGTPNHDLHKLRRAALSPYFSMASVRRLKPVIWERVEVLMKRFEGLRMKYPNGEGEGKKGKECSAKGEEENGVVMLSWAFAAFTNDIVMMYCFGRCDNRLEAPDFDPSYRDASFFGSTAGSFLKHAPWVNNFVQALPLSVVELMHPAMASFVAQKRAVFAHIASLQALPTTPVTTKPETTSTPPTIFHSILSSKLPAHEKTPIRLSDEAHVLTMAGTLTTAWVLELTTYHLLSNPSILRKLKSELSLALPDPSAIGSMSLPALEALPYLSAVIREGLRLTYGVSCRLARRDMSADIVYVESSFTEGVGGRGRKGRKWVIPRGTPTGMTHLMIHHDERIFPDSKAFRPERWTENDESFAWKYGRDKKGRKMGAETETEIDPPTTSTSIPQADEKVVEERDIDDGAIDINTHLHSFTAGSRQCLGINLAHAELVLGLSAFWRVWGSREVRGKEDVGWLELWGTGKRDVEIESDAFLPIPQPGSRGIRVRAFYV